MRVVEATNPWKHLNDPVLMDDTPIGCLRVIPWGKRKEPMVAIMFDSDHELVKTVIHQLHTKADHPLGAIPGKRTFEVHAVERLYRLRDEDRERQQIGDERDASTDLVHDLRKFVARHGDEGAEAIASVSIGGN